MALTRKTTFGKVEMMNPRNGRWRVYVFEGDTVVEARSFLDKKEALIYWTDAR